MSNFVELCQNIGCQFKNEQLLKCALTHRSIPKHNNERLEFLGDAVLGFIIAGELFQRYPNMREGDLSRIRSTLVNRETLAQLAKALHIGSYLILGAGELKSGGQQRQSILADAVEAIIGAIYLDQGFEVCQRVVLKWYDQFFTDLSQLTPQKDPKSTLQEWTQAHKLPLPVYEATVTGAAHSQVFHITCRVDGLKHVTHGKSTSRRKAEQEAAKRFLELLNE